MKMAHMVTKFNPSDLPEPKTQRNLSLFVFLETDLLK